VIEPTLGHTGYKQRYAITANYRATFFTFTTDYARRNI